MAEDAKLTRTELIGWFVTIALTVICLLLPEQGILTAQIKIFLAITVCALSLAAFELVPTLMIGGLLPAAYVFFKCADVKVVMSPWLGTTALMLVGAFFMAVTLEDCGLLQRIAYNLMCFSKGNYFVLLMTIFSVSVIMNIITIGRAYLIMAPLCFGLCVSLNGLKGKIGAGVASAVMIGGCTSHIYSYQASGWGVLLKMAEGYIEPGTITPLSLLIHNWPMIIVSLLLMVIIAKWYKPEEDLGDVSYFRDKLSALGSMTKREKNNLIMLTIVLVFIFTASIHKIDINVCFAVLPWMVLLPFLKGADTSTIKKINFEMIFFVMACMAIGTVATSLGLGAALSTVIVNLLGGSTSIFKLLTVLFGIVFGLNFLMTPLAIFALLAVPLLDIATGMGFNPVPILYSLSACSEAILLPYEYVPYLLVYSFGMISMKDFIKTNILRSIFVFGGFLLVIVPYWMLIGLV